MTAILTLCHARWWEISCADSSEGRPPLCGDVPKSPFIALGRVAAVGRHDLSETAVSFGSPLTFIFPPLRAAFQAASNLFLSNPVAIVSLNLPVYHDGATELPNRVTDAGWATGQCIRHCGGRIPAGRFAAMQFDL